MSVQIGNKISFESVNYRNHYFRHRNGEIWKDKESETILYKEDATWIVRPALNGNSVAISLESLNYKNHYLRHTWGLLRKDPYKNESLYKNDASWIVRPGLAGEGVSLESCNYPNEYIRHQGGRLKKHAKENSNLYIQDSSWIVRNGLYFQEETKGTEEFKNLLIDVTSQMAVLSNSSAFYRVFGFHLNTYLSERHRCVEVLRSCANHIEKVVHDTGIARTTGGAVGITSGLMILGGILTAPFTAGTSLALTAGGAVAGLGSAATTITASIVRDENVRNDSNEVNRILEEMKDKDDKIQEFMEELGYKLQRMKQLQDHNRSLVDWLKFVSKDIGKGIGYDVIYKGICVYQSGKAARFTIEVAEFIEADFYAMKGIAIGMAAPGFSIFGKTLIVAGSSTAKVLSGVFGVVGIGFGIWDVVEGSKDIEGSETANEMREAARKMEEITEHYEELTSRLARAAQ